MKNKRPSLTVAVALLIVLAIAIRERSAAQSADVEKQNQEIVQARQIVQRMRRGFFPTEKELDLLERVLSRMGSSAPPTTAGGEALKPPSPISSSDKHDAKLLHPQAQGLSKYPTKDGVVYTYVVDLKTSTLRNFWLDREERPYGSIARLKEEQRREGNELKFAINGAIFGRDFSPQGLYIEQGNMLRPLDLARPGQDAGNFYLEPNGVFFVDSQDNARILTTERFVQQYPILDNERFKIAIQSGPTLLIDGRINPQFADGSVNKKRRSGVGILGDGRVMFAISTDIISFRDFAAVFEQSACRDALYLDGGPIGSLYVDGNIRIEYESPLVTMLGVVNKLPKK